MVSDRTTRKRQRQDHNEEDSKRQRGRPRVDGLEESAADKRRTQIRLAQRAYRQRKETTIAGLKDKVSALQATVEEMEKTFSAFNDKAVASGPLMMSPQLAHELKKATETFTRLAKKADISDDDGTMDFEPAGASEKRVETHQSNDCASSSYASEAKRQSTSSSERLHMRTSVDIGLGYIQILDDEPGSTSSSGSISSALDNAVNGPIRGNVPSSGMNYSTFPQIPPTNGLDFPATITSHPEIDTQAYNVAIPDPSIMRNMDASLSYNLKLKSLASPYTYSFQEVSFARRLQRAALERGYHLIANADTRPSTFHHIFRLSLLYHTRESLLMRFRRALSKTHEEPLETFQTPFIHLGGAGTHYNTGRVRNGYIVKPGPLHERTVLESVEAPGAVVSVDIDLDEYEGDWYDSNDVEGYLQELGIQISPQSHFAEARIKIPDTANARILDHSPSSTRSDARTHSNMPSTPSFTTQTSEVNSHHFFPELGDVRQSIWANDITGWLFGSGDKTPDFLESGWLADPIYTTGLGQMDNTGFNYSQPSYADVSRSPGRSKSNEVRDVTIDVSQFIDELIKSAVCLGRAPGFRKRDVERALSAAVIQVF